MVNSLSKLALPQNASAEQRKLAVDLTEIIVVWETDRVVKDRTSKLKEKKRQMDNNSKEKKFVIKFKLSEKRKKINAKRKKLGKCKLEHKKPSQLKWAKGIEREKQAKGRFNSLNIRNRVFRRGRYIITPPINHSSQGGDKSITVIINFLIRLSIIASQANGQELLVKRCLDLLGKALKEWPLTKIKNFSFIRQFTNRVSLQRSRLKAYNQRAAAAASAQSNNRDKNDKNGGKPKGKPRKNNGANPAHQAKFAAEDAAEVCIKVNPVVFTTCLQILNTVLHFAKKNKFIPSNTTEIMTLITPSLRCMSRLDYMMIDDAELDIQNYVVGI